MAIKGNFKLMGEVDMAEAYAVVDSIQISKDGLGFAHVSIYSAAPKTDVAEVAIMVDGQPKTEERQTVNRGAVLEHFTVSGIDFSVDQSPFVTAYQALKGNDRLADMLAA